MRYSPIILLYTVLVVIISFFLKGSNGFTIEHALKLSEKLKVMLKSPKYDYLPKLKKYLNLYTGVLSYITLKLKQTPSSPVDPSVKDFYLLGPPLFMKIPVEDKRLALKKTFKWTDHELDEFIEELDDAKKVWQEFAREVKQRVDRLEEHVVNG